MTLGVENYEVSAKAKYAKQSSRSASAEKLSILLPISILLPLLLSSNSGTYDSEVQIAVYRMVGMRHWLHEEFQALHSLSYFLLL